MTQQLNDQQQRAVDHDDGPLLVLAGPGAGKTRVITQRIARLVNGGAEPESILAVTFTTKAAGQMRTRLCELIGVSAAERINLSTFHGFGLRLLQRFADLAALPHEPHIIDSAQRRRLLRAALAAEDVPREEAAKGWDSIIDFAQERIARFRDAALTPDAVFAALAARRAALDANDPGLDDLDLAAERARLERLELVARLYSAYDRACLDRGWLTLDDLITRPIRLLDEHQQVRDIIHAELRHLVVDEFQDVNAAQIELLTRLAPPARRPDLCVVGDDDQAIYMFRGADDQALAHFSSIWQGHASVRLTHNYRSDPRILHVANAVITRADIRYAPDKTIQPALEPKPEARVDCVLLEHESDEPAAIAAMLLEARAADPDTPWHRYAVIGRTHLVLERIGEALRLEDIPFVPAREVGADDDDAVKDVLAWIRLLVDPAHTGAVLRVLARPPISMPGDDAMSLVRSYRAASSRGDAPTFADWVARAEGPAVARFNEYRARLTASALGVRADQAVWKIIECTDPAHADMISPDQRAQRIESLVALVRFARDKAPRLDEPADLAALLAYWEDLDRDERRLQLITRETIDGPEDEQDRTVRGVQLLTAFGAKGLEFDTVFVPRVSPGHGYPRSRSNDEDELPDWMTPLDPGEASVAERRAAEERRIFYVACTRAERRLTLVARKTKSRSDSTNFFQELTYDEPDLVEVREYKDDSAVADVEAEALGLVDHAEAVIERARRGARAEAARALHEADDPSLDAAGVQRIAERLHDAAMRLGVASSVAEHRRTPPWIVDASSDTQAWAGALAARAQDARRTGETSSFAPLAPPLKLSYTAINAYLTCPMCYYLQHVLGLSDPASDHMILGNAAHQTLEWLYQRHREADAGAVARPSADDVRRYGRQRLDALAADRPLDQPLADRLDAQLALTMERLDDPRAEVICIEQLVDFNYPHKGVEHRMRARLDRVDRLPDGGFRIVDYKTGRDKKALLEPAKSDLQLAIYAMALAHHFEIEGTPPGVAEYWVLSVGRRGVIDLADLRLPKIKEKIGEVIDGLLSGRFDRKPACTGPCALFAHDLDPQPSLFPDV